MVFWQIIGAVVFSSIFSLVGGVILLWKGKNFQEGRHISILTSFAVGVLLTTVFGDLLPETLSKISDLDQGLAMALGGILFFFILEKSLLWYHHQHKHHNEIKPAIWLITLGDSIHNFLDGVAVAVAFLINPTLGIALSIAVFAHEVPHEIVDFTILLSHGLSRSKTLLFNLISALASLFGAVITFYFSAGLGPQIPLIGAFAAGNLLYIAMTDLLPELHHKQSSKQETFKQISFLLIGVLAILIVKQLLPE